MAAGLSAKISFLEGLVLGFPCIAPIGLQNLFVFNSVLVQTRSRVLLTAVDVIVFDVTLALACFFGVGAVIDRYVWLQKLILFADIFIVICIRRETPSCSGRRSRTDRTPFFRRSSLRPAS